VPHDTIIAARPPLARVHELDRVNAGVVERDRRLRDRGETQRGHNEYRERKPDVAHACSSKRGKPLTYRRLSGERR
jgi:hypothetical protein